MFTMVMKMMTMMVVVMMMKIYTKFVATRPKGVSVSADCCFVHYIVFEQILKQISTDWIKWIFLWFPL